MPGQAGGVGACRDHRGPTRSATTTAPAPMRHDGRTPNRRDRASTRFRASGTLRRRGRVDDVTPVGHLGNTGKWIDAGSCASSGGQAVITLTSPYPLTRHFPDMPGGGAVQSRLARQPSACGRRPQRRCENRLSVMQLPAQPVNLADESKTNCLARACTRAVPASPCLHPG